MRMNTRQKLTSTLSHLQFPQGAPSTTSQRTLRARHETQARAARRFVTLRGASSSSAAVASEALRFLVGFVLSAPFIFLVLLLQELLLSEGAGEGESAMASARAGESSRSVLWSDIVGNGVYGRSALFVCTWNEAGEALLIAIL
jgi:hypothetical protein